jgi:hypothetical protein
MKLSRATVVLSALFALCVFATSAASAQTSSIKPIFTNYPPYLCVGGGFVAMAGISIRDPLIVIPIDVNGIEAPQSIPSVGDEVRGMHCSDAHIELLVHDYKSDRLIMPLYTVQWHSRNPTTISEEQREDLNLPKSGPTPAALKHRRDSFEWGVNRAGGWTTGDWRIWVPQVVDRPNNRYEVHFVHTETRHRGGGATSMLVVDLLEETLGGKVTKSIPLIKIEADSD